MRLPKGFQTAGIKAGLKPSGKLDLGVIYSRYPLYWALLSTENTFRAPCVSRNRARFTSEQPVNGVVVNSGNANCATGEQGTWDNEDFAGWAANALSLERVQDILTASTGVIGRRLPVDKLRVAVPQLATQMSDNSDAFAEAILTTDTVVKQVGVTLEGGGRIVGVAKGSGMIHPNMATMLAFVMTDAEISQHDLRKLWQVSVNDTFNQVTVDGDTSTNDMALMFSSHQTRVDANEFRLALTGVCERLAKKIARDGEGATKLLTVQVRGARNSEEARTAARAVAKSSLVKAAVHGNDPNWGRILNALGSCGAVVDAANLLISLQGTDVYLGAPKPFDTTELSNAMRAEEVTIVVDLGAGNSSAHAWGCDLSTDYVRINAEYTT